MIFEICVGSENSAVIAQKAGANRVELCSALSLGGLTPSYALIEKVRSLLNIDVNVLIRPREGDFLYSPSEIKIMEGDIECCAKLGVNGVVIGALDKNGNIDIDACKQLVYTAKRHNLSVTFHRAVDACCNILGAVEQIIELGADRILTSGGKATAFEGIEVIAKMNKIAGGRIIIMPGSGVNALNIKEIADATKVSEIHFSGSHAIQSQMLYRQGVSFTPSCLGGDFVLKESSLEKIENAIKAVK